MAHLPNYFDFIYDCIVFPKLKNVQVHANSMRKIHIFAILGQSNTTVILNDVLVIYVIYTEIEQRNL